MTEHSKAVYLSTTLGCIAQSLEDMIRVCKADIKLEYMPEVIGEYYVTKLEFQLAVIEKAIEDAGYEKFYEEGKH